LKYLFTISKKTVGISFGHASFISIKICFINLNKLTLNKSYVKHRWCNCYFIGVKEVSKDYIPQAPAFKIFGVATFDWREKTGRFC